MKMKTNDVSCNRTDHFNMTTKNACRWDQTKNKSTQKLSARNFENRLLICKQSAFYQLSRAMPCHTVSLFVHRYAKYNICVHYQMQTHIVALPPSLRRSTSSSLLSFRFLSVYPIRWVSMKKTRFINKSSHLDMLIYSFNPKKEINFDILSMWKYEKREKEEKTSFWVLVASESWCESIPIEKKLCGSIRLRCCSRCHGQATNLYFFLRSECVEKLVSSQTA